MRPRSIFVAAFFLAVLPYAVVAQPTRKSVEVEPPRLEKILAGTTSQPNGVPADLLAIKPEIPLGPPDVLKEYEEGMALVAENMYAAIATVLQAQQANRITREQAEYLIQERYEVAMMQHQVLSALHDTLEHDMDQAASAKRLAGVRESDTAVVVELPSPEPPAR